MHPVPLSTAEFESTTKEALTQRMAAVIAPENQGPVFREGRIVEIEGARFVIRKIIKKGLVLHGVPSK